MRHSIVVEGRGFRLRPVALDDAASIIALRATERSRYLHPVSSDVSAQRAWLERYMQREGDWYFVVERLADCAFEGLIGIYDAAIADTGQQAEWGRWVLRDGSMAAVESAVLIHDVAFGCLGLARLYCRTIAENAAVVAFHDSMGLERVALLPAHFVLGGAPHDAVEHAMTPERWSERRPVMAAMAARVAGRLAQSAA